MARKIKRVSFDAFKREGIFVLGFGALAMGVAFILGFIVAAGMAGVERGFALALIAVGVLGLLFLRFAFKRSLHCSCSQCGIRVHVDATKCDSCHARFE